MTRAERIRRIKRVDNPLTHIGSLTPASPIERNVPMPKASAIVMQDLSPTETHQTKLTVQPVSKPKQTKVSIPERPGKPVMQRVAQAPAESDDQAFLDELAAELSEPVASAPSAPSQPPAGGSDDADVDSILKRFKGSPDEVAKQLAKSYRESEKRMRQLEAERQFFLNGGGTQPAIQAASPPVVQPVQNGMPQSAVIPQFNYKRFKDDILDRGDEVAQEFEQHIARQVEQKIVEVAAPLYEEALDGKIFRHFSEIVTADNLDLIKAMAHSEPGNTRWEKVVNAIGKYKAAMPAGMRVNPEVQQMQVNAETPRPQAQSSHGKKMWKESAIRAQMNKLIKSGEYTRNPQWRISFDAAYREGRVVRGE